MGIHHIALATRDLEATHRFYTEAMGFTLAKVESIPSENEGGWLKHVFYDTGGGGMMAFWEIHDDALADFDPAISTSQGLPAWVNHLAFDAIDLDGLEARKHRWLAAGIDVVEVDHGWCRSIYANDPNGTLVEWCANTRPLRDSDREEAARLLTDPEPPVAVPKPPIIHQANRPG